MTPTQKAVIYDRVGDASVLDLSDVLIPTPGPERVLVAVEAVGINPYDAKVRSGKAPRDAAFPRGLGADFAGKVVDVGEGANYFDGTVVQVGDDVFGWGVNTLREMIVARASNIARRPAGISAAQAGALATPAFAARALVSAKSFPGSGTILVSGASGAVGGLVAQWGVRAGLRVLGAVSESKAERMRSVGVEPIVYGSGMAQRLKTAIRGGAIDGVYDTVGEAILSEVAAMNTPADTSVGSTVTLAGDEVAEKFAAISATTTVRDIAQLLHIAEQIGAGDVSYPVAAEVPAEDVRSAFELLESGHPDGKVVVTFR